MSRAPVRSRSVRPGAVGLGVLLAFTAAAAQADDFIVYSPHIQATQSEIELRGYQYGDSRAEFHGGNAAEFSVAHSFADWWKPEIYFVRFETDPGISSRLLGFEFENTFQFTQPGEFWADFGFLAAFEHQIVSDLKNAVEFGPLIEKNVGRFDHRLNVIWEKEVGAGAGGQYMLRSSYQGTYAVSTAFRPGVEAYVRPSDRAYQAGPIVAGERHVPGTNGGLEYRVGVVLGINTEAPRQTWLAQIEYEFL